MKYTAVFAAVTLLLAHVETAYQRVCVTGRITCRSDPNQAAGVKIKLWDNDRGPNPDDLMGIATTGDDGTFDLCGSATDWWGDIDPVFKIYHNCNDELTPCLRKAKWTIPDSYIGHTYDFGDIDLEIYQNSEERKCFD